MVAKRKRATAKDPDFLRLKESAVHWWGINKSKQRTWTKGWKPKFALTGFVRMYPHFTKTISFKSADKVPQWFSQVIAREMQREGTAKKKVKQAKSIKIPAEEPKKVEAVADRVKKSVGNVKAGDSDNESGSESEDDSSSDDEVDSDAGVGNKDSDKGDSSSDSGSDSDSE